MTMTLALIGTGLMGAPMARNLLKAGHTVHVWNRSPEKAEALAADGAIVHTDLAEAVQDASHVVTMLSDGPTVAAVLFDGGMAAAMKSGATVIDMSSIRPGEARDHAEKLAGMGIGHLDAPVSGGTKGAEAGTLAIMAGGDEKLFEAARDVFAPMGRATRIGGDGSGQLAKLANQAIVGVTIGVVAEATLLMRQGGGDLDAFRAALSGGFADSVILQQHGKRMAEGNFEPGGRSKFHLKDLDNVMAEAAALGIELPLSHAVRDRFERIVTTMDPDLDHSALFLDLEKLNGIGQ